MGNSQALKESALVEALNLRAAIEMGMGNMAGARAALDDLPPRREEEIDPVSGGCLWFGVPAGVRLRGGLAHASEAAVGAGLGSG